MLLKKDNLQLGLLLGFLAPFFGVIGFYFWRFKTLSFIEFIQYLGLEKHLITGMISFSLLANAIAFTIYVNSRKDKTARGIFIATLVYAIAALILKFWY